MARDNGAAGDTLQVGDIGRNTMERGMDHLSELPPTVRRAQPESDARTKANFGPRKSVEEMEDARWQDPDLLRAQEEADEADRAAQEQSGQDDADNEDAPNQDEEEQERPEDEEDQDEDSTELEPEEPAEQPQRSRAQERIRELNAQRKEERERAARAERAMESMAEQMQAFITLEKAKTEAAHKAEMENRLRTEREQTARQFKTTLAAMGYDPEDPHFNALFEQRQALGAESAELRAKIAALEEGTKQRQLQEQQRAYTDALRHNLDITLQGYNVDEETKRELLEDAYARAVTKRLNAVDAIKSAVGPKLKFLPKRAAPTPRRQPPKAVDRAIATRGASGGRSKGTVAGQAKRRTVEEFEGPRFKW